MLWGLVKAIDARAPPILKTVPSDVKRTVVRQVFSWGARILPDTVSIDGFRLRLPRDRVVPYLLQGHEVATVAVMDRYLQPGDRAVDVGANIGYLTLQMARRVGHSGSVIAIEPAPDNLLFLLNNLKLNEVGWVAVVACGAGEDFRVREFDLSLGSAVRRLGDSCMVHSPFAVAEVPLGEVLEGPVDFVKIDVEGGEAAVLRGFRRMLQSSPDPKLVVEWNPQALIGAGESPHSVPRLLESMGFVMFLIGSSGELEPLPADREPPGNYRNIFARRPGQGS